jgi:hypothetical protein
MGGLCSEPRPELNYLACRGDVPMSTVVPTVVRVFGVYDSPPPSTFTWRQLASPKSWLVLSPNTLVQPTL